MKNEKGTEKYSDIIDMPRPVSPYRKKMTARERAAQFSPFAALVGYDDEIVEAGRCTEKETELSEDQKREIDERLHFLMALAEHRPPVKITYYVPDEKKSGGSYVTVAGKFKSVRAYERDVLIGDRAGIPIERIRKVDSPVFEKFDI